MNDDGDDEEETEDEPPYYVDGCVYKKDHVYIASKYESLTEDDYDLSRMIFYEAGDWSIHDLEWDVRSVCCWRQKQQTTLCALSVDGEVSFATGENFSTERIAEAGAADGLGTMRQIRVIDGDLYACGFHGQVYRRMARGWVHADAGLLERDIKSSDLRLTGIDGTSEKDIYVVGFDGKIHHWNGEAWNKVRSPTKVHLDRVRCVTRDEVYICGYNSALLRGNARDGFRLLDTEDDENFWGIEEFRGKVYFAALSGLFILENDTVIPLETGLAPEIGGYRLAAADGALWSFGLTDLAFFDGTTWTRVVNPDSE